MCLGVREFTYLGTISTVLIVLWGSQSSNCPFFIYQKDLGTVKNID